MGGIEVQLEVEGEQVSGCGGLQVSGLGHSFLSGVDWPAGFCWSATSHLSSSAAAVFPQSLPFYSPPFPF